MSRHTVKVEFWPSDSIQTYFTCTAPPTAECRAVWDCDCEYWTEQAETPDGKPTHIGSEKEAYCVGEYNPDHCMWTDWFDGTDDPLDGEIVLPVECEFDFDHALFRVRKPLPEITDEMVERGAKALWKHVHAEPGVKAHRWEELGEVAKGFARDEARTSLEAALGGEQND